MSYSKIERPLPVVPASLSYLFQDIFLILIAYYERVAMGESCASYCLTSFLFTYLYEKINFLLALISLLSL